MARKEQDRIVLKAERYRYVDGLSPDEGGEGASVKRENLPA